MEQSLLEALEDKQKKLKGVRECIRLPKLYHPDLTWRDGQNGIYYRSSVFAEFADPTDQPARDISALKANATVAEEKTLIRELTGACRQFHLIQKAMAPVSLGRAAVAASPVAYSLLGKKRARE